MQMGPDRISSGEATTKTEHHVARSFFLSLVSFPHLIALFTRTCVLVAQVKLVT